MFDRPDKYELNFVRVFFILDMSDPPFPACATNYHLISSKSIRVLVFKRCSEGWKGVGRGPVNCVHDFVMSVRTYYSKKKYEVFLSDLNDEIIKPITGLILVCKIRWQGSKSKALHFCFKDMCAFLWFGVERFNPGL